MFALVLFVGEALADEPVLPVRRDAPQDVMPTRLWDIEHLDLEVTLDPKQRAITGHTEHHIRQLGRPHDRLRLHQEHLTITRAVVDGEEADFELGKDWVEIQLPPGTEHVVELDYSARPPMGLYFRSPEWGDPITEVWTQGEEEENRWWFPSWDYPNDRFTLTTHITAPDELIVRGLGLQTDKQALDGGLTRWSFALEQSIPNYLVTLVAGEYQLLKLKGRVPIEILAAKTVSPEHLLRTVVDLPDQVAYFEDLLDEPFPYPILRMVFVQRFLYSGMENPTLTILRDRLIVHDEDPLELRHTNDTLSHEVAHHWFGDLLTCYGWNEWWLNEGFARYYEKRWAGHHYGDDVFAVNLRATMKSARKKPRPMAPTGPSRHTDVYAWTGTYDKGAAVLHGLRQHLGPATFERGIQRYIDAHQEGLVDSHDLQRSFEQVSGEHLGWFFEQWVSGAALPTWKARSTWEDGELEVILEPTSEPLFHAEVLVEIGTKTSPLHKTLTLDGGVTRFQLSLPNKPLWIALDPDSALLGTLRLRQSPTGWNHQALRSSHPIARLDAIEALGKAEPTETVLAALRTVVFSEHDMELRAEAIRALGQHRGVPSITADLQRLATTSPLAMLRIAALQQLPNTPASLDLIEQAITTDPHPSVRRAAFKALRAHSSKRSLIIARSLASQPDPSPYGRVHSGALHELGKSDQFRDGKLLASFLDDPRPLPRQAAFNGLKGLIPNLNDPRQEMRLQGLLASAVEKRLNDPAIHDRLTALSAAKVLSTSSIPILERFIATNPVDGYDEIARDAIAKINHPAP